MAMHFIPKFFFICLFISITPQIPRSQAIHEHHTIFNLRGITTIPSTCTDILTAIDFNVSRKRIPLIDADGPCSRNNKLKTVQEMVGLDEMRQKSFYTKFWTEEASYHRLLPIRTGAAFSVAVGIGNPPRYMRLFVDTGCPINWVNCSPCLNCRPRDDPVYDPQASSSFSKIGCMDPLCNTGSCDDQANCAYQVDYVDGASSKGVVATELFQFFLFNNVPLLPPFDNVLFGCSAEQGGRFMREDGLLGLGKGNILSFATQPRLSSFFAYCLPNFWQNDGYLELGRFEGEEPDQYMKYTPMIDIPGMSEVYAVRVTDIYVNGTRVAAPFWGTNQYSTNQDSTMVIDSGTTVTYLPVSSYQAVKKAFILTMPSNIPRAPNYGIFDTCYNLTGIYTVELPTVRFVFEGGVTMQLIGRPAVWFRTELENRWCFSFALAKDSNEPGTIGSYQQRGIKIVYDNESNKIGFRDSCM